MSFRATAPGSLMLLGEYAVLYNKPAIVCAVDKRINVLLTPRNDQRILIKSVRSHCESRKGEAIQLDVMDCFVAKDAPRNDISAASDIKYYETNLLSLAVEKPFQFILGALKHFHTKMRRGCDIEVTAEFSDQIGFGSSAAVTVATLATLISWLGMKMTPLDLLKHARNVIRQVQGVGSGADAAASVYGGVVVYQQQPLQAEKFTLTHPLTVLYSGFKTPTVEAIQQVQNRFVAHKALFHHVLSAIGQCATDAAAQLRKENWQAFGDIMKIQQGLMESLGVNVPELQACIKSLSASPGIMGVKISGSGLGDCVVGLGHGEVNQGLDVAMTTQGVYCEQV